jgi:cullin 3
VQKILADSIRNILVGVILELINVERRGYVINRSAMKSCVDVLLQLGSPPVYKQSVEPLIFRDTESFYEAERLKLLDSSDAPQYLRHV